MNKYSLKSLAAVMLLCIGGVVSAHDNNKKKRWDYIIVGGGTAGCIIARKLSDKVDGHYKNRVLLIEQGGNYLDDAATLDPASLGIYSVDLAVNPKYAETFLLPLVPLFYFAPYSSGHELGGAAAHNNMVAVRGTPSVYDNWAAITGNANWSYFGNIRDLAKALENYTPDATIPNPAERGFDGPIFITQQAPVLPGDSDFLDALSAYTLTPFEPDYNNPPTGNTCISTTQLNITPGLNSRRSCSGIDYLQDVIDENGKGLHGRKLRVLTGARALNFRINDDMRATSVKYVIRDGDQDDQEVKKASLTKHTGTLILCAGSVQTPALLMNSGVGPSAVLNDAGVPVVLDSPKVGQEGQCQYGTAALVTADAPYSFAFMDGYPFFANDDQRRIQLFNIIIPGFPFEFEYPSISVPQSLVTVRVVENNPLTPVKLDFAPYSDLGGLDAYTAISSFKIIKQAADDAGQTVVFPPADHFPAPWGPAPDDSLLFADLFTPGQLIAQQHLVGTAKMGTDISNGVVDGDLNVFGLKNVKIADNSVQPQSADGNTSYPAYLIALVLCQTLGVPTPPAL